MHKGHVGIGLTGKFVLGIIHQANTVAKNNTFVHIVIEQARAKTDVHINADLTDVTVLPCLQERAQTLDLR